MSIITANKKGFRAKAYFDSIEAPPSHTSLRLLTSFFSTTVPLLAPHHMLSLDPQRHSATIVKTLHLQCSFSAQSHTEDH